MRPSLQCKYLRNSILGVRSSHTAAALATLAISSKVARLSTELWAAVINYWGLLRSGCSAVRHKHFLLRRLLQGSCSPSPSQSEYIGQQKVLRIVIRIFVPVWCVVCNTLTGGLTACLLVRDISTATCCFLAAMS